MEHFTTSTASNGTKAQMIPIIESYEEELAILAARNEAEFDRLFAELPEDLTDVDLVPLYKLTDSMRKIAKLNERAGAWQPNPDNLGIDYNGPSCGPGSRGVVDNLVKRWRLAYKNRFKRDFDLMCNKKAEMPDRLREAASELMCLADEGYCDDWWLCQRPESIKAQRAAVRVVRRALDEIEAYIDWTVAQKSGELETDLRMIKSAGGK